MVAWKFLLLALRVLLAAVVALVAVVKYRDGVAYVEHRAALVVAGVTSDHVPAVVAWLALLLLVVEQISDIAVEGGVCKFVTASFEVTVVRLYLPVCLAAELVMAQVQLHWALHLHAVQGHRWVQLSLAVRWVTHWFV